MKVDKSTLTMCEPYLAVVRDFRASPERGGYVYSGDWSWCLEDVDIQEDTVGQTGETFGAYLRRVLCIPNPAMPRVSETINPDLYLIAFGEEGFGGEGDPEVLAEFQKRHDFFEEKGPPQFAELKSCRCASSLREESEAEVKPKARKIHQLALESYTDPTKRALLREKADKYPVPEVYNVLALYSDSESEALEEYTKAIDCATNLMPAEALKEKYIEGLCWDNLYTRSYVRAMHGLANTHRKLRNSQKAEKYYRKLLKMSPEYHINDPSFVNWRYHFLEVMFHQGKYDEAYQWARSRQLRESYGFLSPLGCFYWNLALLEYKLQITRRADDMYYLGKSGGTMMSNSRIQDSSLDGPLIRALQCSPRVLEFLTRLRRIPTSARIPQYMGDPMSLSSSVMYCLSYMEYWGITDGAIDWAYKNANTLACTAMLQNDKNSLRLLGIKNNNATFRDYVRRGIFFDAVMSEKGEKLMQKVGMENEDKLGQVLTALNGRGADKGETLYPSLILAVTNDWPPLSIRCFIKNGSDPYSGEKADLSDSPAGVATSAGLATTLHTLLTLRPPPPSVCDKLLRLLFKTEMYECVNGKGEKCSKCKPFLLKYKHAKQTNFEMCLTVLAATGYKPDPEIQNEIRDSIPFTKLDLLQEMLENCSTQQEEARNEIERSLGWLFPVCAVCKACDNLGKCNGCKSVYYCSRQCQKSDWSKHKELCIT